MSQETRTPGPWAWDSRNGRVYLITMSNETSAVVIDGGVVPNPDDRRLIAAAPALYEALKAIVHWLDPHANREGSECPLCHSFTDSHETDCKLVQARAALAAADGRKET